MTNTKEEDWRTLMEILDKQILIEDNVWSQDTTASDSHSKKARGVRLFKSSRKRLRRFKDREETKQVQKDDSSDEDQRDARASEVALSLDPLSAMAAAAFSKTSTT